MSEYKIDLTSLEKVHASLKEILLRYEKESYDLAIRDAVIQRFEYTYSLSLKMLRRYLEMTMRMWKNPKNDSFLRFFKSDLGSARTHNGCGIAGGMGASRTREIARKIPNFSASSIDEPTSVDGMDFNTVIRKASEIGLILNDLEKWTTYRLARNLTFHTYDENKAIEVVSVIPDFEKEADFLLKTLKKRIEE